MARRISKEIERDLDDLRFQAGRDALAAGRALYDKVRGSLTANVKGGSRIAQTRALRLSVNETPGRPESATVILAGLPAWFAREQVIQGSPYLIVLLPRGEALGLRRITKRNAWEKVRAEMERRFGQWRTVDTGDGAVILVLASGRWEPVYKLQKQVRVPQKIPIEKMAREVAQQYGFSQVK